MDRSADNDHRLALCLGPGPRVGHHRRREPIEPSLTLSITGHVGIASSGIIKSEKDVSSGEIEVERTSNSRSASDELDEDGNARKKLRLTKEQSALLEDRFKEHSTLNPKQKQALAKQLNLRPRQVEVWFQNRRARTKLRQTEVDCEFLKKCYETLTNENRRLQKEVNELRAMKSASSPLYMQLPTTTLTMCPSCERVIGSTGDRLKGTIKPHMFNPFTHSATC